MSPIETLAELFAGPGASEYLGEAVSIATHMLQAGALAQRAGAPDHLVAAALVHDVGHVLNATPAAGIPIGADLQHEQVGANWLSRWFPEEVTEPVRLHVAAKRYLCLVQHNYVAGLSPASLESLVVQGGPMSRAAATAFERLPHAAAAVSVRRWDEQAKDPDAMVPSFETFRPFLEGSMRIARTIGHQPYA